METSSLRRARSRLSDELIHRFLVEKIGLPPERASAALLDFREMRQGSKDRVRPS